MGLPLSLWTSVKREPLFNIPPVIVAVLAVLALIHAARTYVLTGDQDVELLFTFAFIPARYDTSVVLGGALPGGFGAQLWTFVTYSLIHADWTHLGVNAVWLLPFGSAVARSASGAIAMPPPIAYRRSRSPACCAIRACSLSWRCGSESIFCSGWGRFR